ncbi:hypothetical protein RXV91_04320 [Lactiplantibacillus sp. DA1]|uniref:hypothetical protein n=1 Tax=Lactiplantibacillus sp. DA1 TaxID=3079857 RepID=UPI00292A64D8|nr:hypothetical protein [Lactiplantibacillus sp. DA1]MDV0430109.1 hypothetical protein [Lactiplantibacillus sp. DA1]
MAKILYYWDRETHGLNHSEFFMTDDELPNPLPDNATLVAPTNGLYEPITWDGTAWNGTDKDEWLAAHPVPVPDPTAEQAMIMQQATDITQMKQMIMSQASQIATLSKGSAE